MWKRSWLFAPTFLALCLSETGLGQQSVSAGGQPNPGLQQPIRVLTWNVLAPSPAERLLDLIFESDKGRRAHALLQEAKKLSADIIALQEVTADFFEVLREDPYWAAYHVSAEEITDPPGGLLLLSRNPISQVAYRKIRSFTGRYALLATILHRHVAITLVVVHLESPLDAYSVRTAQIDTVTSILPRAGPVIWLGDFNFGDQDPDGETPALSDWIDVWTELRPVQPGYTFDLTKNQLARENAYSDEPSRRLDRILVKGGLRPISVEIITSGGEGNTNPSDHFGIWADLSLALP